MHKITKWSRGSVVFQTKCQNREAMWRDVCAHYVYPYVFMRFTSRCCHLNESISGIIIKARKSVKKKKVSHGNIFFSPFGTDLRSECWFQSLQSEKRSTQARGDRTGEELSLVKLTNTSVLCGSTCTLIWNAHQINFCEENDLGLFGLLYIHTSWNTHMHTHTWNTWKRAHEQLFYLNFQSIFWLSQSRCYAASCCFVDDAYYLALYLRLHGICAWE